ncbi:F-box protein [Senna tora]|uniref:F-box protein n=1 Tax=Senna tora TaxID=362788 RepID=A0A835CIG1_9FABA|nr:F-box protein [Senna tora]
MPSQLRTRGEKAEYVRDNMEKKEESSNMCLLDLPDSIIDYILKQLSPLELCVASQVCTSLRNRCCSNHLWEQHMRGKWGALIGHAAYKEWQCHITTAKEDNPWRID